jgi:hypothetical protein
LPVFPAYVSLLSIPCIPTSGTKEPAGATEIKHGGYRLFVQREGKRVRLSPAMATTGRVETIGVDVLTCDTSWLFELLYRCPLIRTRFIERPAMSKGEITVSNDVGLKRPRIRTCQTENMAVAAPRASFFPLLRLALSAFPSTIPMNEKFARY